MRISRKLFRNTPVQRWKFSSFVYRHAAIGAFGTETTEVSFRGSRILYPGGDHTTLPTLMDGIYEANELDELIKYLDSLTSPITAIDIGANVGIWTVLLARHPNVRQVLAFEPSKSNLSFLRSNLEINQIQDKVVVIEAAVSDFDGEITFDDLGSGATKRISQTGSAIVSSVTLDTYLQGKQIDFIKIDVEGYEPSVLSGAWKTLETCLPAMFIEYSLPQVEAAGLSWAQTGKRLCSLYGEFTVISDSELVQKFDFVSLESDKRLLNLKFIKM
jgi:FkbM family methyltransferase